MNAPQIPTSEASDNPSDKLPSFSPSARESARKRRERTVACGGDTLTPGGKIPSQKLANASCAPAVTEDVAESPEVAAEPLTWPAERPPWWPKGAVYAPDMARRIGIPFTPPVTRASGAHLEPVGRNELDDDAKIPEFLRRHGVGAAHAQPIASDREASKCRPQANQPSGFVPSILRRPESADLMLANHADQRWEHRDAIERLQAEYKRLDERISAMYFDKLDGKIAGDSYDRFAGEWREEQRRPKAVRAAGAAPKAPPAQLRTIELLLGGW